jgi:hypothetical protein
VLFTEFDPALLKCLNSRDPGLSGFIEALAKLKHGIDSLVDAGGWILELPGKVVLELGKTTEQRRNRSLGNPTLGPLEEAYCGDDGLTAFLIRGKEIVRLEGARLTHCDAAECPHLFVRRKRQLFCDKKCSQRERTRLWRIRHALA